MYVLHIHSVLSSYHKYRSNTFQSRVYSFTQGLFFPFFIRITCLYLCNYYFYASSLTCSQTSTKFCPVPCCSYANTTVLSVLFPVASPILLFAVSFACSTIVFFLFTSLQLCQHCNFIVYFPVASLVPLFRASVVSSLCWVLVNQVLLCLSCLCVTTELEKWNCHRSEKCQATKQQSSTEKYCDGDLIMSVSFRVCILFFFLWRCGPTRARASSFLRFLYHTQRRTTVSRTPLDE